MPLAIKEIRLRFSRHFLNLMPPGFGGVGMSYTGGPEGGFDSNAGASYCGSAPTSPEWPLSHIALSITGLGFTSDAMTDDPPKRDGTSAATSSTGSPSGESLPPQILAAGLVWALVVAIGGGWICGVLLLKFRMLGYLSLLAIGVLGGVVSRRISRRSVPMLGWALAAAILIAMVFGQVYFRRYGVRDVEAWGQAFAAWPKMVLSPGYRKSTLIALICAALGAHSACWRAGRRFSGERTADS